jgi:hypothetical protein
MKSLLPTCLTDVRFVPLTLGIKRVESKATRRYETDYEVQNKNILSTTTGFEPMLPKKIDFCNVKQRGVVS